MIYNENGGIDFNAYAKDALRTEKPLEEIVTDGPSLIASLKIAVAAAGLIDLVKKGVIYGKELGVDDLVAKVKAIEAAVDSLDEALFREVPDDYEGEAVDVNPRLLHAALGKFGEAGEIMEHMIDQAEGKELDVVGLCEEFADDKWYSALGLDELARMTGNAGPAELLNGILVKNIAKLRLRYPEKFTLEQAENRDKAAERAVLEG